MDRFALRWLSNAAALYVAIGTGWIAGIHPQNNSAWALFALALVFTVVNALLRPLLKFLTCSLIILSLGLFTLLINTFLFWLTGWIGSLFPQSFGYTVDGFWAAFLGALVVSVVNFILTLVFKEDLKPRPRRERV